MFLYINVLYTTYYNHLKEIRRLIGWISGILFHNKCFLFTDKFLISLYIKESKKENFPNLIIKFSVLAAL